jgi:hypothetical protein
MTTLKVAHQTALAKYKSSVPPISPNKNIYKSRVIPLDAGPGVRAKGFALPPPGSDEVFFFMGYAERKTQVQMQKKWKEMTPTAIGAGCSNAEERHASHERK